MLRHLLVVVGLLASVAAAQTQIAPPDGLRTNVPRTFALENVRLVPRPGEVLERATVVVRDGRIESVNGDVPADAERIDLAGRTMYAGFVDGYSEVELPPDDQANGYWNDYVTPERSAADAVASATAARPAGFVARVVAPADGILRGRVALASTADQPRVIATDLGLAMRHTAERAPWGTPAPYPRSPMGAVALARQALYDAQWYRDALAATAGDPTLSPVEPSAALAALQPLLAGEVPAWIVCGDERDVLRARDYADEFDLTAIAVASGDEYRRIDLVAGTKLPLVVPVDFPLPPDVTSPAKASAASLRDLMDWDLSPSNPAYLHEAGLTLAFTSHGLEDVATFLPNVRRAVARGLPAEAALAMLTTNAADLLGQADQLGTIEPGKLASFVVADGDLFDVEADAKVVEVWVDGERYELEAGQPDGLAGVWKSDDLELILSGGTSRSDPWGGRLACLPVEGEPGAEADGAEADGRRVAYPTHEAANLEQVGDGVSFHRRRRAIRAKRRRDRLAHPRRRHAPRHRHAARRQPAVARLRPHRRRPTSPNNAARRAQSLRARRRERTG